MAAKEPPVLVVGAGIIGLTTAIRLHETNHAVTILSRETPTTILSSSQPKSTYSSSGAGGLWMPFLLSDSRIPKLATDTYNKFVKHSFLDVGVDLLEGFVVSRSLRPLPWYAELTGMTRVTPQSDHRVPRRYGHGVRFTAPIVQMDKYLINLEQILISYNVPIILTSSKTPPGEDAQWDMARIKQFAQEIDPSTIVINCAGMGAGKLMKDTVTPSRGVTVRVRRPKELNYHISEAYDEGYHGKSLVAYAIPRGEFMTLGGTVFMDDWQEDATEDEVLGVKERGESLLGVGELEMVGRWTGLRPVREGGVRLEAFDGVVCNYGHGGSGVTLCWGCADEVVRIVDTMA